MTERIRRVVLRPYRRGMGPAFILDLFDDSRPDWRGSWYITYRLTMREGRKSTVLFEGSDYSPGPGNTTDGDASVRGLLGFLTLRPGDTDREYFEGYTEAQRDYCDAHAEALANEVYNRFGEG